MWMLAVSSLETGKGSEMRALVTGGAGFIGSHLSDALLSSGCTVVVLDNESTGRAENVPDRATYVRGSVTDPNDVETAFAHGIDVVFHLAGQASTIRAFAEPEADLVTNVTGTLNIIAACIRHRVPRILYASSMTVYGHPETLPINEEQPARPISYYGVTKYAAERYLMATAMRADLGFTLHATAFRMFNVYGPRQRLDNPYQGVMGIFVGNVLRDEPIAVFGDGEQTRDFIHVRDVTAAWLSAVDKPAAFNQVFNLGSGQRISINRLIDAVLVAGGRQRTNYPITHGATRPGDQRHMVADIQRVQDTLHWSPAISFETGLRDTLDWARNELRNNRP
jgi:UDP-glucose 4-epimerase